MACSVFLAITLCVAAHGAPPDVHDHAQAFSPDAVARANDRIRDLMSAYGAELAIEFFPSPPDDGWWDKIKNRILRAKDPTNRRTFYSDWAKSRVQDKPDRICVLVCKEPEPLQLEVGIGRGLRQRGLYSNADGTRLRETVLPLFSDKNNDEALATSIDTVVAALRSNRDARKSPAEPFPWTATLSVAGIMTAIWLGLSGALLLGRIRDIDTVSDAWHVGGNYATAIYNVGGASWLRQLRSWPTATTREHQAPTALPVESGPSVQTGQIHGEP